MVKVFSFITNDNCPGHLTGHILSVHLSVLMIDSALAEKVR